MLNNALPIPLFYKLKRDILRVTGEDRHKFLQGLLSNDVNQCAAGKPIYAALLTPQGKFLHDMFIVTRDDMLLIDCESERGADLLNRLIAHKLRAKVAIEDVTASYHVWARLPTDQNLAPDWEPDPRHYAFGHRAIITKEYVPQGGKATHDLTTYAQTLIMHGAPDGSRDLDIGSSTLHEGNLDLLHGVSWSKGCYMGQELTARMQHRTLVKKRLTPVRIETNAPERDEVLLLGTREAGVMRSTCGTLGLACLNLELAHEARTTNTPLTCGKNKVFVLDSLVKEAR